MNAGISAPAEDTIDESTECWHTCKLCFNDGRLDSKLKHLKLK